MGYSSVSLLIVCKYYIVTSNVVSYLYFNKTVFPCTGMFLLPCHPLPTKYWIFPGFGIPLSMAKINCWFFHFLYFFIKIKMKIELVNFFFVILLSIRTCLLTMSHNEFSKCRMICTIKAWTKFLAVKLMSLYDN